MEGVGARLGRSSSRYSGTTVFTGPVRKWKKNWVPITPPPSSNHHNSNHSHNSNGTINGSATTPAAAHLRLYKWTILSKDIKIKKLNSSDNDSPTDINNHDDSPANDDDDDVDTIPQDPPRRKFKFIPVAVLEEQKKEIEEITDDTPKPLDLDEHTEDGNDQKPDINDVPMEENQDSEENPALPARQDFNELDLSLGLASHEGEEEPHPYSKTHPN